MSRCSCFATHSSEAESSISPSCPSHTPDRGAAARLQRALPLGATLATCYRCSCACSSPAACASACRESACLSPAWLPSTTKSEIPSPLQDTGASVHWAPPACSCLPPLCLCLDLAGGPLRALKKHHHPGCYNTKFKNLDNF